MKSLLHNDNITQKRRDNVHQNFHINRNDTVTNEKNADNRKYTTQHWRFVFVFFRGGGFSFLYKRFYRAFITFEIKWKVNRRPDSNHQISVSIWASKYVNIPYIFYLLLPHIYCTLVILCHNKVDTSSMHLKLSSSTAFQKNTNVTIVSFRSNASHHQT